MQVPWLLFPAEVPNTMPSKAGMTVRYSQSVAKTDRRSPERRCPQFQHSGYFFCCKRPFLESSKLLIGREVRGSVAAAVGGRGSLDSFRSLGGQPRLRMFGFS